MTLEIFLTNTFDCNFGCDRLSDVSINLFDRKGHKVNEDVIFLYPKELNSRDNGRFITLLQKINDDISISEVEVKLLDNGIVIHHCGSHLFLFK